MIYYDEVITNDVPINENQFYNMLEYVFELMEQFINEYPELFSYLIYCDVYVDSFSLF